MNQEEKVSVKEIREVFFKSLDPKRLKGKQLDSLENSIAERKKECEALLKLPQVKYTQCYVCGDRRQDDFFTVFGFDWVTCPNCGHIYKKETASYEALSEYLRTNTVELYLDENDEKYRLENIVKPKFDFMMSFSGSKQPGSWLEIATGVGHMPTLLKENGWKVRATELNQAFIDFADKKLGVELEGLLLPDFYEKFKADNEPRFDVVSALGYFEMLPDPVHHFEMINDMLVQEGLFFINGFNNRSLTFAIEQQNPDSALRLFTPANYSYFSLDSWKYALEKTGFELEGIWWHGLDFYEVILQVALKNYGFFESKAADMLFELFNSFQKNIDEKRACDSLLLACRKKRSLS